MDVVGSTPHAEWVKGDAQGTISVNILLSAVFAARELVARKVKVNFLIFNFNFIRTSKQAQNHRKIRTIPASE